LKTDKPLGRESLTIKQKFLINGPENQFFGADRFARFPWWLVGAVVYGISWPMPWSANLSFLAWFAFVFLFVSLEKTKGFPQFFSTVWIFSFITHTICSGWFLDVPTNKMLIVIGAINESLSFTLPFIPFYYIQRWAGFRKSIFILPFLFVITEWLYCALEHNLGYLLVVHSQTENLWLIQYADLFGFLSVTFWVVLFNVFFYRALVESEYRPFSISFFKKAVPSVLMMLALPLAYAGYRNHQLQKLPADRMKVTMISTRFGPNQKTQEQGIRKLDRTVELTDSVMYYTHRRGERSDVIAWHEGAVPNWDRKTIRDFVQKAVDDWQTPLLTGVEHYEPFGETTFMQRVNRVVLFKPNSDSSQAMPYYDKLCLAPGWESIPYLSVFHKLGIRFKNEYKFLKKGDKIRLFEIPGPARDYILGAPICFEQNVPTFWGRMVRLGAEGFIEVSFESWFGQTYFQKQVAYITRLRAIETRRAVARCSNGGLTFFVDSFGRIYSPAQSAECTTTDSITLSKAVTFYTRHPNLFPFFGLTVSLGYCILILVRGKSCLRQ
jgi:apolipoprotein N-acyltransferase